MQLHSHFKILAQAIFVWLAFWLLGLPDYYQQYSAAAVGIGSVILSVVISLLGLVVLLRISPKRRFVVAFWLSFYFTIPLALLDALYCGIYLGHGLSYLWKYWYLTVFYVSPWLTFLPTAALLQRFSRQS
jgi:hypothetical protein